MLWLFTDNINETWITASYSNSCSDVKRNVMKAKKNLSDGERFVDGAAKRNLELMSNIRNSYNFESVWHYNCGICGRTEDGLQLKF